MKRDWLHVSHQIYIHHIWSDKFCRTQNITAYKILIQTLYFMHAEFVTFSNCRKRNPCKLVYKPIKRNRLPKFRILKLMKWKFSLIIYLKIHNSVLYILSLLLVCWTLFSLVNPCLFFLFWLSIQSKLCVLVLNMGSFVRLFTESV